MNIIKRILHFSLGEALESLFREKCPSCGRRGLQGGANPAGYPPKPPGIRTMTFAFCWLECVYCGARFKQRRGEHVKLEIPTEEEWPSAPKPGDGNKA